MATAAYIIGTLVTLLCGVLLLRAYGAVKRRLLLWCGLCFLGLALQNFLVFVDAVTPPQVDLSRWRLVASAGAMLLMLFGLIWEGDR